MSDYLTEDVLQWIFVRVPAKSLLKLRCVCKSWYSLITDRKFISKHSLFTMNNRNKSQLIVRQHECPGSEQIFTLHDDDDDDDDKSFSQLQQFHLPSDTGKCSGFVGFCHGLVCFDMTYVKTVPRPIMLWNASMGCFINLPIRVPSVSDYKPILGFGFDHKSNGHKVVSIIYGLDSLEYNRRLKRVALFVDIFLLSVGEWKETNSIAPPPYVIKEQSSQAFLNGAVHWIGYYYNNEPWRLNDFGKLYDFIVAVFDMSDEVFKELKMPNDLPRDANRDEEKQRLEVGVIRESLALMYYYTQWENSRPYDGCCIWVMSEYGVAESWMKHFKIDLRLGIGKVIGFRRNGEILLFTRYDRQLVSYDPGNRKINKLGIYGDSWSFYMDTYMESLVLLNGLNWVSS